MFPQELNFSYTIGTIDLGERVYNQFSLHRTAYRAPVESPQISFEMPVLLYKQNDFQYFKATTCDTKSKFSYKKNKDHDLKKISSVLISFHPSDDRRLEVRLFYEEK